MDGCDGWMGGRGKAEPHDLTSLDPGLFLVGGCETEVARPLNRA
jgi:hypothetical protein